MPTHVAVCVCGPIVGNQPVVKPYSSPVWSQTTALGWSTTAAKSSMMTEQITHFLLESYLCFLLYSTLRCSVSKDRRLLQEACGFSAAFYILHTWGAEVEHTRSRSWWVKIRGTRVNTHVSPAPREISKVIWEILKAMEHCQEKPGVECKATKCSHRSAFIGKVHIHGAWILLFWRAGHFCTYNTFCKIIYDYKYCLYKVQIVQVFLDY